MILLSIKQLMIGLCLTVAKLRDTGRKRNTLTQKPSPESDYMGLTAQKQAIT